MKKVALWLPTHLRRHSVAEEIIGSCQRGLRAAGHTTSVIRDQAQLQDCGANCVITWGLGHPIAEAMMRQLVGAGVSVVGWDLGYWDREIKARKYRVSIDAIHPQAIVMRRDRPARGQTPKLRDDFSPDGPVLLVGMGFKSAQTYGEKPGSWEGVQLGRLRRLFPGRRILFKPRPSGGLARLPGVEAAPGSIASALCGASLAVCRHSNVGVDAIIANIPAVADDGAAAAVCPHELTDPIAPLDLELRAQFLRNLSWFQWTAAELQQAATWGHIFEMCDDAKEARSCSQ